MADWNVYTLHLSKALGAARAPSAPGLRDLPAVRDFIARAVEGEELLLAFPEFPSPFVDDPVEGPDSGPRLAPGLSSDILPPAEAIAGIPPGDYSFMQWRPGFDAGASLREGLEHFARDLWWAGEKTEGPWLFRALREDGKIAFQLLRAVANSDDPRG